MPNVAQLVVAMPESLPYQRTQTFINANERNVPMNFISYCFTGSQSIQLGEHRANEAKVTDSTSEWLSLALYL